MNRETTKVGLITLADSRTEFYAVRKPLVDEALASLDWLREEFLVLSSEVITLERDIREVAEKFNREGVDCVIIHFPIWADPILSIKVCNYIKKPILLMGNTSPKTSSLVGVLGAGGALDQIGRQHSRIFNVDEEEGRRRVRAFLRAAFAAVQLQGKVLGVFGTRSLGIFTTISDVAQWQKIFDLDIKIFDESKIVERGEAIAQGSVDEYREWLLGSLGSCTFGGLFDEKTLDRQIRCYLSFKGLIAEHDLDFVGNKCQTDLSDGYTTQCLAHMLLNSSADKDGIKKPIIHACESDTDGALTMKILSLLSGDSAVSLMDVRYLDRYTGKLALANCGALAADFFGENDPLSHVNATPHIFGKVGACAFTGTVKYGPFTLARLCRKNGIYWMAIVKAESIPEKNDELSSITYQFPKGLFQTTMDEDFLKNFGSNHLHAVSGDYVEELEAFCQLKQINFTVWK